MHFNGLYWHDAVIKSIHIDRANPGKDDEIVFNILWPNETVSDVIFYNVFWSKMTLNFGIVAEECIYEAFIAPHTDADVTDFLNKWKGLDTTKVCCYVLKTASTGSEIKIISGDFRVIDL